MKLKYSLIFLLVFGCLSFGCDKKNAPSSKFIAGRPADIRTPWFGRDTGRTETLPAQAEVQMYKTETYKTPEAICCWYVIHDQWG